MADQQLNLIINGKGNAPSFFESVGQSLKNLKKQAGEESTLGGFGKILMGTGAVAGISYIGRALGEATSKAVELKNAFNSGAISAGEMADQLARSLPIIGGFWTAGKNIRELVTGEEALVAAIKEGAAARDRASKVMREQLRLQQDLKERIEKDANAVPDAMRRAASAPFEGVFDTTKKYVDQGVEIAKTLQSDLDKLQPDKDRLKDLRDEMTKLQGAIEPITDQYVSGGEGGRGVKVGQKGGPTAAQQEKLDGLNAEIRAIQSKITVGTTLSGVAKGIADQRNFEQQTSATGLALGKSFLNAIEQDSNNPFTVIGKAIFGGKSLVGGIADWMGYSKANTKTEQQLAEEAAAQYEEQIAKQLDLTSFITDAEQQKQKLEQDLTDLMTQAPARFSGGLAAVTGGRFLTGVSAASRENDPLNKIVPLNQKQVDLLQQIHTQETRIADAIGALAQYNGGD